MKHTCVQIPTYDPDNEGGCDHSQAHTVVIEETTGVRVVMGDPNDDISPDLLIERDAKSWRVFVHLDNYSDPLCLIEIRKTNATIKDDWGKIILDKDLS